MSVEKVPPAKPVPPLKRETILPGGDRGRVATLVAMCSLAGVAVGFGLSTAAMQAASEASRVAALDEARDSAPITSSTPWLGVRFEDGPHGGAFVIRVYHSTPAETAGLHAGDVIVGYDHVTVHGYKELYQLVRSARIGDRPVLDVMRGDRELELQPSLGAPPAELLR
jgi:S1-C subfamily serine protease